jgi:hypothetical protein
VAQLGRNADGESLEPGRVPDCYLGLLLAPSSMVEAPEVLVVAPVALLHPAVPQPDGTLLYELVTGHPDRQPRELVFVPDLTCELRAWPPGTWTALGIDPQAAADAVLAGWRRGDLLGLRLGGLTDEEALALQRPAITYVRAQLRDRLTQQVARALPAVAASKQRTPTWRPLPVAPDTPGCRSVRTLPQRVRCGHLPSGQPAASRFRMAAADTAHGAGWRPLSKPAEPGWTGRPPATPSPRPAQGRSVRGVQCRPAAAGQPDSAAACVRCCGRPSDTTAAAVAAAAADTWMLGTCQPLGRTAAPRIGHLPEARKRRARWRGAFGEAPTRTGRRGPWATRLAGCTPGESTVTIEPSS